MNNTLYAIADFIDNNTPDFGSFTDQAMWGRLLNLAMSTAFMVGLSAVAIDKYYDAQIQADKTAHALAMVQYNPAGK